MDIICITEDLSSTADIFRSRAKTLKTHMWWKECKVKLYMCFLLYKFTVLTMLLHIHSMIHCYIIYRFTSFPDGNYISMDQTL